MHIGDLIDPGAFSFPDDATLDLHDVVGILLRERLLSDTPFQNSKLVEVCDGSWPPTSVGVDCQATFMKKGAPKVGYFLKTLEAMDAKVTVEPYNFLNEGLTSRRELDVEEVETIFWRVKNYDSGFLLHHALQLVLDYLPKSASLRIRTSDGYSLSCASQSFAVAEMEILPRQLVFINATLPGTVVDGKKQIPLEQATFGEKWEVEPWVYLVFGEEGDLKPDRKNDKCVAVDINLSVLGIRGLGRESFAMERRNNYHSKLLSPAADEDLELVQSPRIFAINHEKARPAIELARRVLTRLERFVRGLDTYCSYCGKTGPKSQCSRCGGKSKYCGSACQKKAWPYHRTWCENDARMSKCDGDVVMKN